jgi:hypothetical protein
MNCIMEYREQTPTGLDWLTTNSHSIWDLACSAAVFAFAVLMVGSVFALIVYAWYAGKNEE